MQLKQLFRGCGFIFSVKINKGVYDELNTATVQFLKSENAIEAIEKLDRKEVEGEQIRLRLGCKECQVFLKIKSSHPDVSNILKKILGEHYDTCYISQTIQNRHKDKVLVHVHF